jgi:CTP:molybdopterin cytidylyltransferase MocA
VLEQRLEHGPLALYRAYEDLDVAEVEIDSQLLADVDTPAELEKL